MADNSKVKVILIVLLLLVLLIAIATKAAHWDKVTYKNTTKDYYDEVYPGLEGTLAMDAIIFVGFVVALIFHFKPNREFTKYLLIFLILCLVIRIVLALLFLAGDHEYCRKQVKFCDDYGESYCSNNGRYKTCTVTYCAGDWFKTLKGAWVFEIIAFILVNIFSAIVLFLTYKESS